MADLPNLSLLCLQAANRPSVNKSQTPLTSQECYDFLSNVKHQMWDYFNSQKKTAPFEMDFLKEPRVSDVASDSNRLPYQLGIAMSALALR